MNADCVHGRIMRGMANNRAATTSSTTSAVNEGFERPQMRMDEWGKAVPVFEVLGGRSPVAQQSFAIKVCRVFSYKVLSAAVLLLAMCGTACTTCCQYAKPRQLAPRNVIYADFVCSGSMSSAHQNALPVRQRIVTHRGNEWPFEGLA